ncbi:MAG: hypothetical protein M3434_02630 [Gemmatimonadota bacterium]|nr:hypothetical protein [Gemmatimonadota bacterium]
MRQLQTERRAALASLVPNPGTAAAIRGVNNIFWFVLVNSLDPFNAPVLHDMRPGSDFVQRLQALQGTEAGRAYSRVGIGTSASPSGIACHGVMGGDKLLGVGWKGCYKTIRVLQPIYTGVGAFMSWTGRQHVANQF